MKKLTRGLLTAAVAVLLCAAMTICSFAVTENGTTVCKRSYDTYEYTQDAHPLAGKGTYTISKGVLKENDGTKKDIYLVAAHGLEATALGYGDDFISCLQAGFDKSSVYEKQCIAFMKEEIPANANVVLVGHSLGGMIMQQIAADKGVKKRYNVLYTVTFGSPKVTDIQPEGTLNRMCAKGDAVPWLSKKTVTEFDKQLNERNEEDTGFSTNTHVAGYRDQNAWKNYDAVGQKKGKVTLTIDDSTTVRKTSKLLGKNTKFEGYASVEIDQNYMGIALLF